MNTPADFMDYFRANYPGPTTIISNPDYHAPKIYRAAIACSPCQALLQAAKDVLALMDKVRAEEGDPLREIQDRIHGPVREALQAAIGEVER